MPLTEGGGGGSGDGAGTAANNPTAGSPEQPDRGEAATVANGGDSAEVRKHVLDEYMYK